MEDNMSDDMQVWLSMCNRLSQDRFELALQEGKSKLLDVCAKEFGNETVFSTDMEFNLDSKNLRKVFTILDQVVFGGKIGKIKGLNLEIGSSNELNSIASAKFGAGKDFDMSSRLAVYLPCLDRKVLSVGPKRYLKLTKTGDAILINTNDGTKTTFAYALAVICHEMVHCLDANEGNLIMLTQLFINRGYSMEYIDRASHYTPIFAQKVKDMKTKYGLTIPITAIGYSFEELNQMLAQEAKLLQEAEETSAVFEFSDAYKEENKDRLFFTKDGQIAIVFGSDDIKC